MAVYTQLRRGWHRWVARGVEKVSILELLIACKQQREGYTQHIHAMILFNIRLAQYILLHIKHNTSII